jgi:hypothetical protein
MVQPQVVKDHHIPYNPSLPTFQMTNMVQPQVVKDYHIPVIPSLPTFQMTNMVQPQVVKDHHIPEWIPIYNYLYQKFIYVSILKPRR